MSSMTFTPDERRRIREGRKSMHRFPATPRDCRYREGNVYRIPVDGDVDRETITVTSVRRELLSAIKARDATREGAKHARQYITEFVDCHGGDRDQEIFVIEFARGDLRDRPRFLAASRARREVPICRAVDKRTGKRCGRGFVDGQTRCACGATRTVGSADDDYGYTSGGHRALRDAGEALSDSDLQRYTQTANANSQLLRDLPLRQRIAFAIHEVGTLKESMQSMKARNRARLIERELELLEDELPSGASC